MQRPLPMGIAIGMAVSLCVIWLHHTGRLQFLELTVYDYYVVQRSEPAQTDPPPIALITVSEDDIRRLGHWPMNDATMARMLEILLEKKPRVIGLDMYRDIPVPPGSETLKDLFKRHQNIVTIKKPGDENSPGISEPFMVGERNPVGFSDFLLDPAGTVRRGLLFLGDGEGSHTSFALILALIYLEQEGIKPLPDSQFLSLGKATLVPLESNDGGYVGVDARGYQFLLDYRDGASLFRTFSLADVLSEKVDPSAIGDRVVIIGSSAESAKDFFSTPFSRFVKSQLKVTGVVIHAGAVSQLIRLARGQSSPLGFWRETCEWGWIVLWGLAGSLLCLWIRSLPLFMACALFAVMLLFLFTFLLFRQDYWVPVTAPAITSLVSAGLMGLYMFYLEKAQRGLLMGLFSTYVSGDVAEAIWEQKDQFMDGGRPRSQTLTATVLFTDIRDFTQMAENMNAQAVIDWLNEYLAAMVKQVSANKGIVDKYVGDAIMAVFGVPVPRVNDGEFAEDAVNAVCCALSMGRELEQLNRVWLAQGRPTAKVRIGIHTGPLRVGSVGSAQRLQYTVIGDTVNIASRLESFDKSLGSENTCRILISNATQKYLGERFRVERLTEVQLKGKSQWVEIHQVLGEG